MPEVLSPVPGYRFPEGASIALARAAAYASWRNRASGQRPRFDDVDSATIRRLVENGLARGGGWLQPTEASALLSAVGINTVPSAAAADEDHAVREAQRLGYPAVMKAVGTDIVHKTDVGGIRLDLNGEQDVRQAWRDMRQRLGDRMSGVLIQPMVTGGVEMLLGVIDDPTFGHVLACATGGTLTEILGDRQLRLHPLTDVDAADMVSGLRGAALLRGYRGSVPVDERALVQSLLRLSALVDLCPEIQELDINPLVVLPTGTCALDVRVKVDQRRSRPASRRVSY
jgi:acyl-CoA synthetase (NDP forming)